MAGRKEEIESNEYVRRMEFESEQFEEELIEQSKDGLFRAPEAWTLVEAVISSRIERATGHRSAVDLIISELNWRERPNFLSLGAGTCVIELEHILPRLDDPESCTLECIDVNENLMNLGKKMAEEKHLNLVNTRADINQLKLEPESYDLILCWASLHHFVELDHIASEINRGLKPDGLFITMDICSRNGFLLWPETKEVVKELWDKLPEKYHHSHTYGVYPGEKTRQFGEFPDFDMSAGGFECIRSEDILPALEKNLIQQVFIPATAFVRRFFDAMFGPNFDLSNPFDLEFFVNAICRDEVAIATGELKPETFFGVYSKR